MGNGERRDETAGDDARQGFEGWAILELMGHRRLAGRLSEATIGGGSFIRIDVPAGGDRQAATQFYAPGAVYAITPTTEDLARRVAHANRPEPVSEFEIRRPRLSGGSVVDVEGEEPFEDDDDADDDGAEDLG